MQRKLLITLFFGLCLFVTKPLFAGDASQDMKDLSAKLCTVLAGADEAGFVAMLDNPQQKQWWWDSSGKGKYFNENFSKCEFESIDVTQSTDAKKKVFIQRYDKAGAKWGRPAPVVFENKNSAWVITSYSL